MRKGQVSQETHGNFELSRLIVEDHQKHLLIPILINKLPLRNIYDILERILC